MESLETKSKSMATRILREQVDSRSGARNVQENLKFWMPRKLSKATRVVSIRCIANLKKVPLAKDGTT